MSRSIAVASLLGAAACASEDRDAGAAPAPDPAALTITVPSPKAVIPACTSPFIQIEVAGADVGCGVACASGAPTCTVSCPEYLGLVSGRAYEFSVAYLQSGDPVARAVAGGVTLAPGPNQLSVPADAITQVDANDDGVADLTTLCR